MRTSDIVLKIENTCSKCNVTSSQWHVSQSSPQGQFLYLCEGEDHSGDREQSCV